MAIQAMLAVNLSPVLGLKLGKPGEMRKWYKELYEPKGSRIIEHSPQSKLSKASKGYRDGRGNDIACMVLH